MFLLFVELIQVSESREKTWLEKDLLVLSRSGIGDQTGEKEDGENKNQFWKGKIHHGLPDDSIVNSTS